MRQLVRIAERHLRRQKVSVQLYLVEKRSHISKHTHSRIYSIQQQLLGLLPLARGTQPHLLRDQSITAFNIIRKILHLKRRQRIHICSIQILSIVCQELLEHHLIILLPLYAAPLIKALSEIVHPPPHIEPHNNPHRQLQLLQANLIPPLFLFHSHYNNPDSNCRSRQHHNLLQRKWDPAHAERKGC